ncbi:hypothetical protein [Candidatus Magnetominusculus dajiuhuensis]|uniref:hypothetical protein n=1 Tax=Candidatus Magnetominusculus dajiuhuensis TaxID=3137712 RepID=UPI003B4366B8
MRPHKLRFLASSFALLTVLSYMVFEYLPFFDYTKQEADITPITASVVSNKTIYDLKDFSPTINNIPPSSVDGCKLKSCGESFNWSVRTYADEDKNFKITIKITRHQSHDKALVDFDNYIAAIRISRFDRALDRDDCRVFTSGVKKLRWDFPSMPNGLFESRVVVLKNNVIIDVIEISKSKKVEYKNQFLNALGRQLVGVSASGDIISRGR